MSFKYVYPFLFVLLIAIPLLVFSLIGANESQTTFVAISGVASFLFGLLATYTLTGRHGRLDKIVQNAAIERGELTFIAESLNLFGKQKEPVMKHMEEYLMAELDLDTKLFHQTDESFLKFYDSILKLKIETEKQKKMYDRLLMAIEKIEDTRKSTATLFEDRIARGEWVILYFLIGVIYMSLLFANTGGVVALFVILAIAAIISYLIIVTIKLDRMRWKVDEKIFEPYAQTMETIGFMRYYPKDAFSEKSIKRVYRLEKGTKFRVGHLNNPPDLSSRTIEIHQV